MLSPINKARSKENIGAGETTSSAEHSYIATTTEDTRTTVKHHVAGVFHVKVVSIKGLRYITKTQHPFLRVSLIEQQGYDDVEIDTKETTIAEDLLDGVDVSSRKWINEIIDLHSPGTSTHLGVEVWIKDNTVRRPSIESENEFIGYFEIPLAEIPFHSDNGAFPASEQHPIIAEGTSNHSALFNYM
jgi:hypothetical protein